MGGFGFYLAGFYDSSNALEKSLHAGLFSFICAVIVEIISYLIQNSKKQKDYKKRRKSFELSLLKEQEEDIIIDLNYEKTKVYSENNSTNNSDYYSIGSNGSS